MVTDPCRESPFPTRESFTIELVAALADSLQTFIGLEDSEGFVSVVANRLARRLGTSLRSGNQGTPLDPVQIARALVEVKRRIGADFRVVHADERRIVLANGRCPFGAQVEGRPALCAITSGLIGHVAADHLGYARVELNRTIAAGDRSCHVTVHLDPAAGPDAGCGRPGGVEYFADRAVA